MYTHKTQRRHIKYFYISPVFSRTKRILVSFFISRFLFHRSISDKRTFIFTQRGHPSVDLVKPVSPTSRKSVTKYSISRTPFLSFSYFYSRRKRNHWTPWNTFLSQVVLQQKSKRRTDRRYFRALHSPRWFLDYTGCPREWRRIIHVHRQ